MGHITPYKDITQATLTTAARIHELSKTQRYAVTQVYETLVTAHEKINNAAARGTLTRRQLEVAKLYTEAYIAHVEMILEE